MNNLANLKRQSVEETVGNLRHENPAESRMAGELLVARAKEAGLSMRDYLNLTVDVTKTEDESLRNQAVEAKLSGYDLMKVALQLPVANDFEQGILLQAAADTFQTFPGTRGLFPEVIDDMVTYRYKQDQMESVDQLVAQSRTINGVEMISTVIADKADDYDVAGVIAETANIPVSSIRTSQQSVGIFKHGMGYRTSYEFERRISLDILTPYANRAQRQMELSRVRSATNILVNGHALTTGIDPSYGAAPEVDQSSLDSTATAGEISWKGLLKWLVNRAKDGLPIDTVLGNYDAYFAWLQMFAVPQANQGAGVQENLARAGFNLGGVPLFRGPVNFVLSSSAPAGKLVGFSKADTLEELVEAGSLINESDRSVRNQTISYFRTMNTGFRLIHGDTRSVYDFAN
jgi:hypothetical protein